FQTFSLENSPENGLDWLRGTWQGTALQINPANHTWTIDFTYSPGAEEPYIINYPSIPCGGHWELVSHDYHRAVFKEHITDGIYLCANQGTVIITYVDEQHISFTYFLSGSDKLDSYATLRKVRGKDF
ncbi:MAG: hypothetical protein KDD99_10875, partial [Bacteroidetes bacterium]|nr:hypothetical protein [Bacteroidota bacterium]